MMFLKIFRASWQHVEQAAINIWPFLVERSNWRCWEFFIIWDLNLKFPIFYLLYPERLFANEPWEVFSLMVLEMQGICMLKVVEFYSIWDRMLEGGTRLGMNENEVSGWEKKWQSTFAREGGLRKLLGSCLEVYWTRKFENFKKNPFKATPTRKIAHKIIFSWWIPSCICSRGNWTQGHQIGTSSISGK